MTDVEIIPAILPKDFDELERKLSLLKDVFLILGEKKKPIVQIDICDGIFVPTQTWPYSEMNSLERLISFSDNFDFEIDLFVQNPSVVLPDWQKVGVKRIVLHIESLVNQPPSELFENLDVEAIQFGFSVNLQTPTKNLEQYIRDADFFQFMGIDKVGYQGEKFNKGVLKKIKIFHEENPNVIISVDGGVDLGNSKDLITAGVSRLVAGSAIFGGNNTEKIVEIIKKFKNMAV